jgi:Cobalamin synthesis G C-terminus
MAARQIVVGVGCSSGAACGEILELIDDALREAALTHGDVRALATLVTKWREPAIRTVARVRGWPVHLFRAETLAEIHVANPSESVRRAVGTPSVAEAAAIRGASILSSRGEPGLLLVEKRTSPMVTVAIACPSASARPGARRRDALSPSKKPLAAELRAAHPALVDDLRIGVEEAVQVECTERAGDGGELRLEKP